MATGRMPEVGQVVPDFELPDSASAPQRLSSLVKGSLVLLFYRGDW